MNAETARSNPSRHGTPAADFTSIIAEIDTPNDRAAAIVAAAFVENRLALAIQARFRGLNSDERKALFNNRGSLSDFAGKIVIGYALSIYGPLVRDDLNNIRAIRNKFAHHLEVRDFTHDDISKLCAKLNAPNYLDMVALPAAPKSRAFRDMYLDTSDHLAKRFDLESKNVTAPASGVFFLKPEY